MLHSLPRSWRYYKHKLKWMTSEKRLAICIIGLLAAVYLLYNWLLLGESNHFVKTKRLDECIGSITSPLQSAIDNCDALHFTVDKDRLPPFLPFVGNGHFGAAMFGDRRLFLRRKNFLQASAAVDLLLDFRIVGFSSLEKVALHLVNGELHKFGCYKQHSMCVSMHYMAVAHRTIPYLLLQELNASNPTTNLVNVQVIRHALPRQAGRSRRSLVKVGEREFTLTTFELPLSTGGSGLLSVGEHGLADYLSVRPGDTASLRCLTFVKFSELAASESALLAAHAQAHKELRLLLNGQSAAQLKAEHAAAWRQLWQQGFSITKSLAPGTVNGDSVNRTLYYLMSQSPAVHDGLLTRRLNLSAPDGRLLHAYDRCFGGHGLLQVPQLWRSPTNGAQLTELADQWLLTLIKFGCSKLVTAGAKGVLQAALLAIGEFSFSGNHLEFNMHSSQLVRDMAFRSIAYGPGANVSVIVEVDDSNKAQLFVSVLSAKQFYACGAACAEDTLVKLSSERVQLPLRITRPRTSLLYVTPDRAHIGQLRRAIHVQEVRDAPAHEHHVIALHKHGHPYGGLPVIFWVALVLLLVIFHLFLFKLIYTELWKGEPVIQPYQRRAYP